MILSVDRGIKPRKVGVRISKYSVFLIQVSSHLLTQKSLKMITFISSAYRLETAAKAI